MADGRPDSRGDGLKRIAKGDLDAIVRLHEALQAGIPGGRRALLSFYDLGGVDLSGRDLAESDFTGARLAQENEKTTPGQETSTKATVFIHTAKPR